MNRGFRAADAFLDIRVTNKQREPNMNAVCFALAQGAAFFTAIQFVLAMRCYFAKRDARRGNYVWTVVALGTVVVHTWGLLVSTMPDTPRLIVGILLLAIANALFWLAVAAHGTDRPSVAFGATVPDRLVTSGPYRFVRHPFYLAYLVAFLAASFLGGHWLQFLTTALLFACYNYAAAQEERMLSASTGVGRSYQAYIASTWRWAPLVW